MNTFLFATWDGGGNVPPLLGIAAELQRRGHGVRVLGHPQQADAVQQAGPTFTPYRNARHFSSTDKNSILTLIAMFGDRGMGADLIAEVEREPADLVVVDCLLFGALEGAERTGLRYVALEHLFDEYFEKKWLRGPMGLGMLVKRLATGRLLDGAQRRLVASLPALDPAGGRDGTGNVTYTGPVVTGLPATPERPTILISLSTYEFPGQTAAMQNIIDACSGLDARVVVTTGPVIDPDDLHWSANTEVHQWVPHADLLPEVSLVIGHGGHATTMIALAHDIPLLILPMHPFLDQPMVGKALEAAGAGRTLPKKSKPEQLRPVIEELLADGPHREAAARLGAAIRSRPGATTAADTLLALVTSGNGASV